MFVRRRIKAVTYSLVLYVMLPDDMVVVVVVVVYLTTNQRHVGYLSSGNGHLAGRKIQYPLGSREPTPLGVQGRPVTISQNRMI